MNKIVFILFIFLAPMSFFAQGNTQNSQSGASQEAVKLSQQVVALFQQKKYAEALPIAKQVVEIREKESGKTSLLLASAYRNLAYVQQALGKQKDSAGSFENALDIYEKNQPLSASDRKVYVDLLGVVATNQAFDGNLDGAEKKLRQAVEFSEKFNGAEEIATADAIARLTDFYQATGANEKASPLLLQALDIRVKKSGKENEATHDIFENATCVLTKLGRKSESDELENRLYPHIQTDDQPVVSLGVVNGKAINLITPAYPAEAKAKRVSGTVNVHVTINEQGKIIHACAVSGAKELQRASEVAAYQSAFSPTTVSGNPVKVSGVIVYNYVAR